MGFTIFYRILRNGMRCIVPVILALWCQCTTYNNQFFRIYSPTKFINSPIVENRGNFGLEISTQFSYTNSTIQDLYDSTSHKYIYIASNTDTINKYNVLWHFPEYSLGFFSLLYLHERISLNVSYNLSNFKNKNVHTFHVGGGIFDEEKYIGLEFSIRGGIQNSYYFESLIKNLSFTPPVNHIDTLVFDAIWIPNFGGQFSINLKRGLFEIKPFVSLYAQCFYISAESPVLFKWLSCEMGLYRDFIKKLRVSTSLQLHRALEHKKSSRFFMPEFSLTTTFLIPIFKRYKF